MRYDPLPPNVFTLRPVTIEKPAVKVSTTEKVPLKKINTPKVQQKPKTVVKPAMMRQPIVAVKKPVQKEVEEPVRPRTAVMPVTMADEVEREPERLGVRRERPRRVHKIGKYNLKNVIINGVLIAIICFTALILLSPLIGWSVSTVVSGSMEPAIGMGSVVVTRPVNPADIKVNDIILFRKSNVDTIHRVIAIETKPSTKFIVKGDANSSKDPSPVTASEVKGILFFHIPLLGYALSLIKTPLGIVLFIGIPAVILIASEIDRVFIQKEPDRLMFDAR